MKKYEKLEGTLIYTKFGTRRKYGFSDAKQNSYIFLKWSPEYGGFVIRTSYSGNVFDSIFA